jgi:hypothetical protein
LLEAGDASGVTEQGKRDPMKLVAGTLLAAGFLIGTAGVASAGERTGTGSQTPIRDVAASECAFSGLEDFDFEAPVQPGVVQNWATAFKAGIEEEGVTVSQAARGGLFKVFGPGANCRGN